MWGAGAATELPGDRRTTTDARPTAAKASTVGPMETSSANKTDALLSVAALFDEHGEWPVRQYVDAKLEQDHELELDDCLTVTPRALVAAAGHGGEVTRPRRVSPRRRRQLRW